VAELAEGLDGDLDVLVNMAGGNTDFTRPAGQQKDLAQVAAAWRANLDANLLSAVLTTTAVLGRFRPGGSIINVGSIGAEYASTSYGAAKAALAAATHDGRAGHPSDIAETAYFLASAGARHITGQIPHVNGGAHTTR
jgi:3-oxoacyl-[acyl-carrier protein] reductase